MLQAVVLGVVQGLTEFLPISSDGHLALAYAWFGIEPDLTFEIFLHGATLIAMYAYFWRDIVRIASSLLPSHSEQTADRRLVLLIVSGTLASGIVAMALEPVVEPMAADLVWVAVWFLCTAALLVAGEVVLARRERSLADTPELSVWRTGFIGIMQGLAVLPGLSRSGSTISSGMIAGLEREPATRFSFLLGIPIITLAFALDVPDMLGATSSLPPWPAAIVGFVAAAASGYAAVWFLLRFVKGHRLYGFAIYTASLGGILLATALLGRG